MTVPTTIDASTWLGKYFDGADADTDLARAMLQSLRKRQDLSLLYEPPDRCAKSLVARA